MRASRHAMLTYAAACAARSQRQSDLGLPSDAPPVLPVDTLAAAQPRAIIHRADRMQGIGISMAGFQLAFQLAERSNRSLYTDWEMFLVGFEGIEEPPEALESADSQVGEAWTWEREGHEKQPSGTAARLAAADKPTVVELSGDDLSVAQVRDAWRAGGAPRSAAEEEKVFEDLNRHRLLERYTPNKYVRENLAALGSHERVVHIRVGDGGGPDGEGPCHVEDSRINLSAGMAALQQAILDHWKLSLANASSVLLLSDCAEVYNEMPAFSRPPWGWLHHSNLGATASELEQTWAEWLAMVNATEIMHTPSAFSSMAVRTSSRLTHEWQLCNGGDGGFATGQACSSSLVAFLAAASARHQLQLLEWGALLPDLPDLNRTAGRRRPRLPIRRVRHRRRT